MPIQTVHTIDLHFMGRPGTIACYLVPHARGIVLIECGPSSTIPSLQAGLKDLGFTVSDITDVLLTHIHLDHAGAAGWLARQGARIHVHPIGAPHLKDPEKLLASARRIYGDSMDTLWGEFLPVPPDKIRILQNNEEIDIHGLRFRSIDTPGHAEHHYVYLFEDVCFSGDIGGIRLAGLRYIRLPMPPPDLHIGKWRNSLRCLCELPIQRIAPTHFGIYDDVGWHLNALSAELDQIEVWIDATMPSNPSIEDLNDRFIQWSQKRSLDSGIADGVIGDYEIANPSWMSSQGILRYWNKYKNADRKEP
jgi:glyoxylase-like metal-dependent hydrolase (beta-lactamase superfamily II)